MEYAIIYLGIGAMFGGTLWSVADDDSEKGMSILLALFWPAGMFLTAILLIGTLLKRRREAK